MMTVEEINKKYSYYEGNILRKCHTKYIGGFYLPQSEPCELWYDWEREVRKIICNNINEDSNFIDIGANFGYFTLLSSAVIKKGTIYAIEPNPFVFDVLQMNIASLQNAVTYNYTLSNKNKGNIDFFWRDGANGNGRSYNPTEHDNNEWKTRKVNTINLNFFIDKQIDMIKMDIEGAEYEVLQDSNGFFRRNSTIKLVLELHKSYIVERFGNDRYNEFMKFIDEHFLFKTYIKTFDDRQYILLDGWSN